jgi:hypothetical protein
MRMIPSVREIASEGPLSGLRLHRKCHVTFDAERLRMVPDSIPSLPSAKSTCTQGSHSIWTYFREGPFGHSGANSGVSPERPQEEPPSGAHPCMGRKGPLEEPKVQGDAASGLGHSLFQEVFFFCAIKNVGDVPGMGCIFVETVVDRDSGIAFAKVYSAKNAMNAVDILSTRVIPFFEFHGITIREIHTHKTSEYCGLVPVHPFETFLATSDIQHLPINQPGQPYNYLCEQFYRFLQKDFFQPALRRKFQLSLDDLQRDLDTFVEAYNAARMKHAKETKSYTPPATKFPVDL